MNTCVETSTRQLGELQEQRQLRELLGGSFIPSKALYSAWILFQKQQDGSLWLSIEYWALNKFTIKKYLLPLRELDANQIKR